MSKIQIHILDPRLSEFDYFATYDLRICKINAIEFDKSSRVIEPGETIYIGTGVTITYPRDEMAAFVIPRTGFGCQGISPMNSPSLIHPHPQAEIIICLHNFSSKPANLFPLQPIASLILIPIIPL